ncbi:helix-turn-helix transcriptional regulator [Paenibacillus andongensis]|uniref:helix-turn-helix transcriptional regulator n=1 Tax=Paenibacillus andongensis TaxID=2975482 RepID=UPI0021BB64E4|nr:LuxR family transcriptional regulator [Paenibacillus andongensis]
MFEEINAFDVREYNFIVGRHHEISLFSHFLDDHGFHGKNIWNLYGTGGVGKSTLLQVFRLLARQKGAYYILLDSRDCSPTGHDLLKALHQQIKGAAMVSDPQTLLEATVSAMYELAAYQKVILAFDTFEELTGLDPWLREHLLKWLPDNVLVLIAGRHPLKGSWLVSPSWRERILPLPVEHLNREDSLDYLRRCGINQEERMERIWYQSKGHPLALSLTVAIQLPLDQSVREAGINWFLELAALWLKEVPNKDLRRLVEAASMLRQFNQEMLSYLLNDEVDTDLFESLTGLSFVQQSERGWTIHDLMREATCRLLRERTPDYYRYLIERCAFYYANAILDKSRKINASWEVMELFHYVEDYSLRAMKHMAVNEKFYWEPLTDSTLSEAQAYVEARIRSGRSFSLNKMDPDSGMEIQFDLTAEESTFMIRDVDLHAFHEMDSRSVQLLRSEEGEAVAIAVLIPLHEGTLSRLEKDPVFHPFLTHLAPSERSKLETPPDRPAGWFMRSLNYSDQTNPTYIAEGMKLTNSYMCAGGIFVISPPSVEAVQQVFLNSGFEEVPGVTHCHYDGKTPTPYFIVDTREDGLKSFLSRLLRQSGIEWTPANEKAPSEKPQELLWTSWKLTQREQQVADLVVAGCSNAEIGKQLFISEVTVKKHLSSIFEKVDVKNRALLVGKFMKQNMN